MIENTLIDYPVTSKYFNEQLFTYVGSTNNCLLTSQLVGLLWLLVLVTVEV